MAEDVARAVGANGAKTVKIAGKDCNPRPLTVKELTEIERECLDQYKTNYIRTFSRNINEFPEEFRKSILEEKVSEAAKWDVDSLPKKWSYDPGSILLTEEVENFLKTSFGYKDEEYPEDLRVIAKKRLVATALDSEQITPEQYHKMTGSYASRFRVGYVEWWMTGSLEGMMTTIWMSFKPTVTKDEIMREIGVDYAKLASLARDIEALSTPQVGNG